MATFTNQAFLSYNGMSVASNIVTGQMLSPLSITKTAVVDTYGAEDSVTYVVSIVNSGSATFENLTLTDDLGSYSVGDQTVSPLAYREGSVLYFINGTPQADPNVTPGAPLVITGINVPAGGNAIVIYEASITAAAPLAADSEITNTVTLTGDGMCTPLEAEEVITVEEQADLTISKSLFPSTVQEDGEITYTFVLQNYGNTAAEANSNITIRDRFDPILRDISVALNGTPLVQGTDYNYRQSTGQFTTVSGRITVPAAAFAQNVDTGNWETIPGETVLTVSGTVGGCPG